MSKRSWKGIGVVLCSLVILTVVVATGLTTLAAPGVAQEQEMEGLFVATNAQGSLDQSSEATVMRSRFVDVDIDMLVSSEVGDRVALNFFPDALFPAILDRKAATQADGFAWIGHIDGQDLSQVILVVGGGQVAGNVSMPGAHYQVRYAGNEVHAVKQVDQSAFPPELEPQEPAPSEGKAAASPQAVADACTDMDVMVVWTPAARTAAGGVTAMQNLINLAVAETNQSYANSGVIQRINLAHMEEVSYTESGDIFTDRNRLTANGDGYMDNVHTLRNTHHADLVSLVVETTQACGVAWIMTTVSPSFESSAFSVVARTCATGYYSYGHEMGHNMGARHDWYADNTLNSPYSYNKGYVNVANQWRTIMAYNTECADNGVNCTRLQYWSNPDVLYGGNPMGVPIGTSTACVSGDLGHPACDADNRRVLNNTCSTVANFRDEPEATGPVIYWSHTVDDDNSGNSSGNNDGWIDCGETIELYVDLYNQGIDPATVVNATISTSDPYVTFLYNTSSSYPDIPGSASTTNADDFDFLVDAATPHDHWILFNLDITASNGGPWPTSFSLPVFCLSPDAYEPDNDVSSATPIASGVPQTHNIYPVGDEDWVSFTLAEESEVLIETSGPNGDSRMWLYDSGLNELEYNDDGGAGYWSRIDRVCGVDALPAGTYYVKVDAYGDNWPIAEYDITYTWVGPCAAPPPAIDVSPTSFFFQVPPAGNDSDILTISNAGLSDLTWSITVGTEPDVIGDWLIYYDWGCVGAPGSAVNTYYPDHTFATSQGGTGTWTLAGSEFVFTFSNGVAYAGYVAGSYLAGTMATSDGTSTGCWTGERVAADPLLLTTGEMTASGEAAGQPGATNEYLPTNRDLTARVKINPAHPAADTGGLDRSTGLQSTAVPHRDLSWPLDTTASGNVLWDLTHGVYADYEPAGAYSSLVSLLASAGYTVDTTTAGLDNVNLAPYDIIVVSVGSTWNTAYTTSEVAAIEAFVNAGGGLLVMGDNASTPNAHINPVAQAFGTTAGVSDLAPNELYISDLAPHPISAGVSEIYYRAAGEVAASPPSALVAWEPTGLGAASVATAGSGKVVALGDFNAWDNSYFTYSDNQLFAANVFNWLARSWLSANPSLGVTSPGASSDVVVGVDAAGLPMGTYHGGLAIHSNDPGPDRYLIIVPVAMEVGQPATLWSEPPYAEIPFGGTFTVDVMVGDVVDLYGASIQLTFDPAYVEVVDDDSGTIGVQITPGTCPAPDFVAQNSVDNGSGIINYVVSSLAPSPPCNGSGVVASITFHGLAESPDFPLHFNDWLLADTNGFEIPAGFSDGTLRVIPAGSVNGHVYLQGRGDHSGAEVCVWDGSTNMGCVLTASDGSYEIGPLPAATYAVTAVMDRYLDSERLGVVVGASAVTLPAVTLKGGDANDDCDVNILDLSLMGGRYGLSVGDPGWDDRADINADGTINIQDIVLGGSNFGTTCPVPWP